MLSPRSLQCTFLHPRCSIADPVLGDSGDVVLLGVTRGTKVEDKAPRVLGPADKNIHIRDEGPTVLLCGDSDDGHYDLGQKYKGRIGQIQKTFLLLVEKKNRKSCLIRMMITFSTSSGNTIRKPIAGRIWVQRDRENLLLTEVIIQ